MNIRQRTNTQDFTHNNRKYKRRESDGQPVFDIQIDTSSDTTGNNTGGGASVTTGDNPPANPTDGDLWYDTSKAQLHVYTGALPGWIQANGGGGSGGSGGGVDWNTYAVNEFADSIQTRTGIYVTRYCSYQSGGESNAGSAVIANNGANKTYFLHTPTGGTRYSAKQGRSNTVLYTIRDLNPIAGSNMWVGTCKNYNQVSMKVKLDMVFGSDTDDNTRFGVWYTTRPLSSTDLTAHDPDTLDVYNATWTQILDPDEFRGNGWGSPSARQYLDGFSSKALVTDHEITVPAYSSLFIRTSGELYNGSNQYESVGLKSINFHSPIWS